MHCFTCRQRRKTSSWICAADVMLLAVQQLGGCIPWPRLHRWRQSAPSLGMGPDSYQWCQGAPGQHASAADISTNVVPKQAAEHASPSVSRPSLRAARRPIRQCSSSARQRRQQSACLPAVHISMCRPAPALARTERTAARQAASATAAAHQTAYGGQVRSLN